MTVLVSLSLASKYALNVLDSQTSTDLQHHIFVKTQGDVLYKCPAGKDGRPLQRVLDVGTGTGVWSMDVGKIKREQNYSGHTLTILTCNCSR